MNTLIPCQACGRQVSTAARQCMNCGHPLKVRSAYTWVLVMLVLSTFAVVAVGLYRMLPLIMDSTFSTAPDSGVSKQDTDGSFGASSLPSSAEKYTQLPLDGRQPTKRELSGAAQKLDAAAVPYWKPCLQDRSYLLLPDGSCPEHRLPCQRRVPRSQ